MVLQLMPTAGPAYRPRQDRQGLCTKGKGDRKLTSKSSSLSLLGSTIKIRSSVFCPRNRFLYTALTGMQSAFNSYSHPTVYIIKKTKGIQESSFSSFSFCAQHIEKEKEAALPLHLQHVHLTSSSDSPAFGGRWRLRTCISSQLL